MADVPCVLRIVNWADHFENNRTKDMKLMQWVPIPNKMDGDGYTELVDHPNGAAHFGAWIAIVEIASKCEVRGSLVRKVPQEGAGKPQEGAGKPQEGAGKPHGPANGFYKPHTPASLCRISRIAISVFEEVIPRLIEIGWIEYLPLNEYLTMIPQEGAGKPQEGASSRTRSARFRSVPFLSVPEGGAGETSLHNSRNGGNSTRRWDLDEQFCLLRASFDDAGVATIDADWADAYFVWPKLDFEQKLAAIDGIRKLKGQDPDFIKRPRKYLETSEWERIKAKAARVKPFVDPLPTTAELQEREKAAEPEEARQRAERRAKREAEKRAKGEKVETLEEIQARLRSKPETPKGANT